MKNKAPIVTYDIELSTNEFGIKILPKIHEYATITNEGGEGTDCTEIGDEFNPLEEED